MQDDLAGLIERLNYCHRYGLLEATTNDRVASYGEAATALETLTRERDEARAEVERLKLTNAAIVQQSQIVARADERTRTQLTAMQARLVEAVNILRASVWTEPTFHYQRHWFQRGRDFCAEYDAQQEGQSNG